MKAKKFRPNVAAVILHPTENKVLMFRRIAKKNEAGLTMSAQEIERGKLRLSWQFPQGGVDPGESEEETLFRELEEEIGTKEITIIRVAKKRVRYYYPRKLLYLLHKRSNWKFYRGQQQLWFLVRLKNDTDVISFAHQPAEFDAFEWGSPRKCLKKVVPFKRKAYRKGLRLLGVL